MDKETLLKYWAGELLAVKMELEKIAFLLQSGVKPTRQIENHLDRKQYLEDLIEEIRKKD